MILENLASRGIESGKLLTMLEVPTITAARMSKATGASATIAHEAYALLYEHAQGSGSKTLNCYKERALLLPATPAEVVPADNDMLREYMDALHIAIARALPTLSGNDNSHRRLRTETAIALGVLDAPILVTASPIEPDDTTQRPKPAVAPKPAALQAPLRASPSQPPTAL